MNKRAHLICNAHIDPVWLWQRPEGAATAVSTFRIAADFCEEFDGFVFNHNEALLYEWVEEFEPALFARIQRLVKEGKTLAVGVSNWTAARIEEANRYARSAGKAPLAVSQIQWSLARTTPQRLGDTTLVCMDDGEYARYRQMGLPVMAYSSQAGGLFTKWLRGGEEALSEGMRRCYVNDENRRRLGRLTRFCRETGCPPSAAVLAYITHNPLPGAALIGCSRLEQLEDSLAGCDRRFTPEEMGLLRIE